MADTEVGGLVVKVRADLTDALQKLEQFQKETETKAGKIQSAMSVVGKAFAVAGAAIGAFAATAVKSAMEWGEAVDDLSDKTGMAGEESSKLLLIAKRVGIAADEAGMLFTRFARSATEAAQAQIDAREAGKESADIYSTLGIKVTDANDQIKSASDIFGEVRDKISAMPDGLQKTAYEMELFGRSGAKIHDMLHMTTAEIQAVIDRGKALGLILSTEQAAAWEMLGRDVKEAKSTLTAAGIAIGNEMRPQLREMLNELQNLTKAFVNMEPSQRQMVNNLVEFASKVGAATLAVRALALALGLSLNPWVAAAIATAAATKALDDYLEAKKRVDSYEGTPTKKVTVYENGKPVERYFKKVEVTDPVAEALRSVNAPRNEYAGYGYRRYSPDEEAKQKAYEADVAYGQETGNPVFNEQQKRDRARQRTQEELDKIREASAITPSPGAAGDLTVLDQYLETMNQAIASEEKRLQLGQISRAEFDQMLYDQYQGLLQVAAGDDEIYKKTDALLSIDLRHMQIVQEQKEVDAEFFTQRLREIQELSSLEQEKWLENLQRLKEEQEVKLEVSALSYDTKEEELAALEELYATYQERLKTATGETRDQILAMLLALNDRMRDLNLEIPLDAANAAKRVRETWADNLADIITNTRSAHDILKQMWGDFVADILKKQLSIAGTGNIFTDLFGGLFGLNTSASKSGGKANPFLAMYNPPKAAGGWDVPDVPGDIPALLHSKEMVLPADLADMVRSGKAMGGGGGPSVVFNQTFQGATDPAIVAQLKQANKTAEATFKNLLQNDPATRRLVKSAAR